MQYEFEGRSLGPFSPIRKQNYAVVFHLMQRRLQQGGGDGGGGGVGSSLTFNRRAHGERPRFIAECYLQELADQETHEISLFFCRCDRDGNRVINDEMTDVQLHVQMLFQYSKILPLKKRLQRNEEQLKVVEKELAAIGSGNVDPKDIRYEEELQRERIAEAAEQQARQQQERKEQQMEQQQGQGSDLQSVGMGVGAGAGVGVLQGAAAGGGSGGDFADGPSRVVMMLGGSEDDSSFGGSLGSAPSSGAVPNPAVRRGDALNPEAGDLDDINSIV